ncbi:MAG: phage tail protein [Gallionella sp.]|nr:phage tail protein [Gallionella sp.]
MSDGYPFSAFNFEIRIRKQGEQNILCGGAFSDCDGLDMSMEVKTIRQGGDNARQIRLAGPVTLGQITLKRGMTEGFDLWHWFSQTLADPSLRADAQIVMFANDRSKQTAMFNLERCIPVKIKAPALNARDGVVAIEELQLAYETLRFEPAKGGI